MLVKYTYSLKGNIVLPEQWPIAWDRYRVIWNTNDGKAVSITVAVQVDDLSGLPKITQNPRPGISLDIDVGHQPYLDEVESILRTATGLLGFFAVADLDLDRPTFEWEAETDSERELLQMHRISMDTVDLPEAPPFSFDLVARCFLAAIPASEQEIPLRFLAKGRQEMRAGRFIDAFYNLFFFFETQFAPGYSSPKKVAAKFSAAPEIVAQLSGVRALLQQRYAKRIARMSSLLAKSDAELLGYLVDLRGTLHHHAMPKKDRWHPEKHDAYEAEATILFKLASLVAQQKNIPLLFSDALTDRMLEGAKSEGAEFGYLIEAQGKDPMGHERQTSATIMYPSKAPSYITLQAIEDDVRGTAQPFECADIREYVVKSADGGEVFAYYKNYRFDG